MLALALAPASQLLVEQRDDCEWYAALDASRQSWYDAVFDAGWFDALLPPKRCAYAAAVKDFESFLDSHPVSDLTGTALAPLLLRQAFHSSGTFDLETGTGGSNGGTIRFAEELEDPDNACVKGASAATAAAFATRYAYVTQADAIVLGAYVALRRMGFPQMSALKFTGGRIDTPWHIVYRGRLPSTEENSVKSVFVDRMGFTNKEAAALVGGAHNFGGAHAHCSGYVSSWTRMPTVWTIDSRGSEFFRNLMQNDWKFFNICHYLNGTETRVEAPNPFNSHVRKMQEVSAAENAASGFTLAMYLNQEPFTCESQFINSKGLMMLVSDFHLREAPEFQEHAAYYASDPTDQLALDFAGAFTKLVNLGLKRCGMFGGSCAQNEECVPAPSGGLLDDVMICSPLEVADDVERTDNEEGESIQNEFELNDDLVHWWWLILATVVAIVCAGILAFTVSWNWASSRRLSVAPHAKTGCTEVQVQTSSVV